MWKLKTCQVRLPSMRLGHLKRDAIDGELYLLTCMIGGCGQMFNAIIVSPQFVGKKMTLARHRLVNGVLKEEISKIHAWTPKCYTPEEWEKQQQA